MNNHKLDLILDRLNKIEQQLQESKCARTTIQEDLIQTKKYLELEVIRTKKELLKVLKPLTDKIRDVLLLILALGATWGAYTSLEKDKQEEIASKYLNEIVGGGCITLVIHQLIKHNQENKSFTQADNNGDEDVINRPSDKG